MIQIRQSEIDSFEAEVVEVFERNGRRIAKVLVHSFFVEVDAAELKDAHLGDTVQFVGGPDDGIASRTPRRHGS